MTTVRALIDGDVLVYRAAFAAEKVVSWDVENVEDATERELLTAWTWPDESAAVFDDLVSEVLEQLGAAEYVVALSSESNFRKDLLATYKANRKTRHKPIGIAALRNYVEATHETLTVEGLEADDVLGIMATSPPVPTTLETSETLPPVVCSIDKDLLTVPGLHFNWDKPESGVLEVSETEADDAFLAQALTGDRTDGYEGLRGIGPVKARKILAAGATGSLLERWETLVLPAWTAAGHTREEALTCARMARILRHGDFCFETYKPKLWGE